MESKYTKIFGYSFIVIMLVSVIEIVGFAFFSMVLGKFVWELRIFYPKVVSQSEIENYRANRDPRLGWPSKDVLQRFHGQLGERKSPANDRLADKDVCYELYGDSFTFSNEVDDAAAWPNVAAEKAGCRILNFGVGGYGIDQAVLRHEQNSRYAPTAGLVIFPVNIRRNLNRQRSLIADSNEVLNFKPRFVVTSDGELELIETFDGTASDFQQVLADPRSILEHEAFIPEGGNVWAKILPEFPYGYSLLRLVHKLFREINFSAVFAGEVERLGGMNHSFFYLDDPVLEEQARTILNQLVSRFSANCAQKDQKCFVFLMPNIDLIDGSSETRELVDYYLRDVGQLEKFVDLSPGLVSRMDEHHCFYYGKGDCSGHFNKTGYAIVSDAFVESMKEHLKPGG